MLNNPTLHPAGMGDAERQRLLYEFNLLPAAYADQSWLSDAAPQSIDEKASCLEQSAALLRLHGIENTFDWAVQSSPVRLSLLQRPAFERVCTALGLMSASELRKKIKGEDMRSLHETFGDLFEAIWTPEALVLAQAGATQNLALWQTDGKVRIDQARNAGYRVYKSLLCTDTQIGAQSVSRALFKLPKAVAAEPVMPIDQAVVKPVMRWLCRSVVKRWEPSWVWLF